MAWVAYQAMVVCPPNHCRDCLSSSSGLGPKYGMGCLSGDGGLPPNHFRDCLSSSSGLGPKYGMGCLSGDGGLPPTTVGIACQATVG